MVEKEFLVPQEKYLKSGVHIGIKFKTKYMESFIYKTRPEGLSVLNVEKIDERLKNVINLLSNYNPEEIVVVSKRENSWKPLRALARATGMVTFPGRYPPGMITNPSLDRYKEAKIIFVVDSWPDKNAVSDAIKIGIPVIGLCDTNNTANGLDLIVPCNNKGKKSLGLIFWIIAREFLKKKGVVKNDEDFDMDISEFVEE